VSTSDSCPLALALAHVKDGARDSNEPLVDTPAPHPVERIHLGDAVALGLGGARNIAYATSIVEHQFEHLPARHPLEPHLGVRPVERAFDAPQVEVHRVALTRHRNHVITSARRDARISTSVAVY